jgi:MoxR-like ATPase
MLKVFVRYPSFEEEFEIARRTTAPQTHTIEKVLSNEEILQLQHLVREVPVSNHVIRYALALVRQTRVGQNGTPTEIGESLAWGAGPRAVQFLIIGAKARALLNGRFHATTDDVAELAHPVLRHRLVLNFAAESDGITPDAIIDRLLKSTPTNEDDLTRDARFQKIRIHNRRRLASC